MRAADTEHCESLWSRPGFTTARKISRMLTKQRKHAGVHVVAVSFCQDPREINETETSAPVLGAAVNSQWPSALPEEASRAGRGPRLSLPPCGGAGPGRGSPSCLPAELQEAAAGDAGRVPPRNETLYQRRRSPTTFVCFQPRPRPAPCQGWRGRRGRRGPRTPRSRKLLAATPRPWLPRLTDEAGRSRKETSS